MGRMGLLSPQVSKILDELELDDKSSSDEGEASLSGDSEPSSAAKDGHKSTRDKSPSHKSGIRKAQTSPLPQPDKKVHLAAPQRPSAGSKHPHLARFHSLRSMLFQNNIEANMNKCKEAEAKERENQWKVEHEKRQGLNRPKTPESPPKEGFKQRLENRLRRLTSKEVPTMSEIKEIGDNESTASDDGIDERRPADDSDINHSDIEDLVRWVSRRDPPSDGETRRRDAAKADGVKDDTDHESLGQSDVEDLVRWISRRDKSQEKPTEVKPAVKLEITPESKKPVHNGHSDESTQSDSEEDVIDEQDVDDLVRWVSRRDGPNAGPVRETKDQSTKDRSTDEFDRWRTREDSPSGESDVPADEYIPGSVDGQKKRKASVASDRQRVESRSSGTRGDG